MKLWQVLVPTVRPDGRFYRLRYHRLWDAKVRELAGGLTVLQPVSGQWVANDGTVFRERMIPVLIACSDEQISAIADLVAEHYQQVAVFYFLVSEHACIKHYNRNASSDEEV